MRLLAV